MNIQNELFPLRSKVGKRLNKSCGFKLPSLDVHCGHGLTNVMLT